MSLCPAIPSVASLTLLIVTALAAAQDAAPQAAEPLKVVITGVEGLVQVREAEDAPWQRAAVGMELGEQAEFRTGPRSAVRFSIGPEQTITLDRLGTVKILQAVEDQGKLKTDLGMKYGRTRYDIEAAGREHESTISSPSSTLAVRGTKVSLYDQRPFPAVAVSLTGRAAYADPRKRLNFGGPRQGKTTVTAEQSSAAAVALAQSVVDPNIALARTDAEADLIAALLSRGSVLELDRESGIKIVKGGRPLTDEELIPVLPGSLNFVVRWTGAADLNVAIGSPGTAEGEFVYPVLGFDIASSGGRTAFDHQGGPNGGMEVVFWPSSFPTGLYGIGVVHISGEATPVTIDAFIDGQRVGITDFSQPRLVETIETTVSPQGTTAAVAPINTTIPGFEPPANQGTGNLNAGF